MIPDVARIAVLRANAIGDFIFTLPALDALRAGYPQAEIVLLGQPWHAGFLAGRPSPIDRVAVVPPIPGVAEYDVPLSELRDARATERFIAEVIAEQFDLALQVHGGGRYSNPFIRQLGARICIGLKTPDAEPLDRWTPYIYYQTEIVRYLEVVALAGCPPVTLEPRLSVVEADLAAAERVLASGTGGRTWPLVVIHPGAGDSRRRWPPEKFAAVADRLVEDGARVCLSGVERERDVVAGVIGAMRRPVENLCGRLSLQALAGLLSRCSLAISNDSGPLHLAAAVGAPTVGIYWCGNVINAAPLTRARHRPALSWRLSCPVCGRNCTQNRCDHAVSFVADVSVSEVFDAALDLLVSTGSG